MKSKQSQTGAYTLLTVFVVSMSLGAFGVLWAGHASWEKGRIQGIADLTALTAARQMSDGPGFEEAYQVAGNNGLAETDSLSIACIINGAVTNDCNQAITARVTLRRNARSILAFFSDTPLVVTAEATVTPTVIGSVGSGLVSVNTNQSALLNGLLGTLGGGAVNLSVAQYGSLLGAQANVNLLDLKTALNVASMDDLLNLQVSALRILEESIAVSQADPVQLSQLQGVLGLLGGALSRVNLRLADVLAVDLSGATDTPLLANLGQLAQVTLLNAVKNRAYNLPISSGLLNLDANVRLLEAPQVFVGTKSPYKNPLVRAKTAQVALDVRIRQPLNINLALISLSALDMKLQARVGGGLAEVNDLRCKYPRATNQIDLTVVPAAAELCIAQSAANLNTTTSALTCGAPSNILNVNLLGAVNAGVELAASASVRNSSETETVTGVAPFSVSTELSLGQSLSNLIGNLNLQPQVKLPSGLGLLSGAVNGLVPGLLNALRPALQPVLATTGTILDGLVSVLGVDVNSVTVDVASVNCQTVMITK